VDAVADVTFTVRVQELLAAIDPPVRLMLLAPAVAVYVPPQVLAEPLGVATVRLVGKVSLTATPAIVEVLAFEITSVIVDVPLTAMLVGLKALTVVGGTVDAMKVAFTVTVLVPPASVKEQVFPEGVHVTLPVLVQLLKVYPEDAVAVSVTVPVPKP